MKPTLTPERAAQAALAAGRAFEVPPREVIGRCRLISVTRARLALYAALYQACETSYPEMARLLNCHHTTILYGVKKAFRRAGDDTEYAAKLALIAAAAAR